MKKTVLRYGIYAFLLLFLLMTCSLALAGKLSYDQQEVAGYLSMLLSTIFIFYGIRYYRNEKNNGTLTFGQGLKLGVLIALVPAVLFGLFDILYTNVINPEWHQAYMNHYIDEMKRTLTPAEFEIKQKEFKRYIDIFSNPFFEFLLMAGTVFIIGFIVTIISSLALRRKAILSSHP